MAGTFEGRSDLEWKLFADLFPPEPTTRRRGMPHPPFRQVVNTLLSLLITGYRWGDLPGGPPWAAMQGRFLGIAEESGIIQWHDGAVDGAFSPWQGGR